MAHQTVHQVITPVGGLLGIPVSVYDSPARHGTLLVADTLNSASLMVCYTTKNCGRSKPPIRLRNLGFLLTDSKGLPAGHWQIQHGKEWVVIPVNYTSKVFTGGDHGRSSPGCPGSASLSAENAHAPFACALGLLGMVF